MVNKLQPATTMVERSLWVIFIQPLRGATMLSRPPATKLLADFLRRQERGWRVIDARSARFTHREQKKKSTCPHFPIRHYSQQVLESINALNSYGAHLQRHRRNRRPDAARQTQQNH